jgi:hypothetical protein
MNDEFEKARSSLLKARSLNNQTLLNHTSDMIKNYFKIAWRNLKASRFYSIITLSGLAVGLATGIMLLLWVQNECSYDTFNKQYKNIYS